MTAINTSQVLVLGDRDTAEHLDMLGHQAAAKGAVITQTFTFDPGAAAAHEELTEIDAVVAALGRAIATHTDIWLPFPVEDLRREEHFRRLSLALQRHGLNLLMGNDLVPCPVEGGYSAIDAALRAEVRAVDELDFAALASAGVRTLGIEIEMALAMPGERSAVPAEPEDEPPFDEGAPAMHFSTAEVAAYLGRSSDWISRGLRNRDFTYPDGSVVMPLQAGRGGRRRFTVAMMRAIAWSSYRRGTLSQPQLHAVLVRLATVW